MPVHVLTEVEINPGQERAALWAMARLAQSLGHQPGFRGLRVFHDERSAEILLALTEWEDAGALTAAEENVSTCGQFDALRAACRHWRQRRLEPLFQLELPRPFRNAALAQGLQIQAEYEVDATARQKTFGLKAMSLPGTVGVLGGRCMQDSGFFFCAVEFETEAARLEFLGTPAWHAWTRTGTSTLWRKVTRLEVRKEGSFPGKRETERHSEDLGSLSVHIESAADGANVLLRLRGSLDDTAAARFERVRDALIAGGCRALTLDVSDLRSASPAGLKTLLIAARQVKSAGGQFSLVDHQGRYEQILRVWHLNQALASPAAPRRRPVRIPSPGKA
jgi:anti-anti-sigma factor